MIPEYPSVLDRESEILVYCEMHTPQYPLSYSKYCSHWLCQIIVKKANPGELVLTFDESLNIFREHG